MDQTFLITTGVIAVYLILFIRNSDKYIIISYLLLIYCTYNKISFQKLNLQDPKLFQTLTRYFS